MWTTVQENEDVQNRTNLKKEAPGVKTNDPSGAESHLGWIFDPGIWNKNGKSKNEKEKKKYQ